MQYIYIIITRTIYENFKYYGLVLQTIKKIKFRKKKIKRNPLLAILLWLTNVASQ